MNEIKRFDHVSYGMVSDPNGEYIYHSDHEAEVARLRADLEGYMMGASAEAREVDARGEEIKRLRAEVELLRNALAPFAEFALVRSAAGSTSPKAGPVYSVHTRLGDSEITAEDFEAAFNAIGASA